jgi:hypothetical protein
MLIFSKRHQAFFLFWISIISIVFALFTVSIKESYYIPQRDNDRDKYNKKRKFTEWLNRFENTIGDKYKHNLGTKKYKEYYYRNYLNLTAHGYTDNQWFAKTNAFIESRQKVWAYSNR